MFHILREVGAERRVQGCKLETRSRVVTLRALLMSWWCICHHKTCMDRPYTDEIVTCFVTATKLLPYACEVCRCSPHYNATQELKYHNLKLVHIKFLTIIASDYIWNTWPLPLPISNCKCRCNHCFLMCIFQGHKSTVTFVISIFQGAE